MAAQRTKYVTVVGFLGIVIAAVYINAAANLSPSIFALLQSLREEFVTAGSTPSVASLAPRYRKECPKHRFKSVKIVSPQPNIMIIEEFLTSEEAQFLINAA
jgi:Na+/H+-dicarboxylate symporter